MKMCTNAVIGTMRLHVLLVGVMIESHYFARVDHTALPPDVDGILVEAQIRPLTEPLDQL